MQFWYSEDGICYNRNLNLLVLYMKYWKNDWINKFTPDAYNPKISAEPVCILSREISADPSGISWANLDQRQLTPKLL